MGDEGKIGFMVFFGKNFDSREVSGEAGALKLVGLFFGVAFGDHDEAVAGSEVGEGVGHIREEFDLLIGD